MLARSISHLIAQTLCECDGKDWLQITSAERDRYARIAILAEDRIRVAVLDGVIGRASLQAWSLETEQETWAKPGFPNR